MIPTPIGYKSKSPICRLYDRLVDFGAQSPEGGVGDYALSVDGRRPLAPSYQKKRAVGIAGGSWLFAFQRRAGSLGAGTGSCYTLPDNGKRVFDRRHALARDLFCRRMRFALPDCTIGGQPSHRVVAGPVEHWSLPWVRVGIDV